MLSILSWSVAPALPGLPAQVTPSRKICILTSGGFWMEVFLREGDVEGRSKREVRGT